MTRGDVVILHSNDKIISIKRCTFCNKKLGVMPFKCRCNELFCLEHRYPESHNCKFDYKLLGKDELTKKNPQVIANKIIKL